MINTHVLKNQGYQFREDWFSHNIPNWQNVFNAVRFDFSQAVTIIEIGSYEGLSASWIAENLLINPESRLYCIDTFEGSVEHSEAQKKNLLESFLSNVACTQKEEQIICIQQDSFSALADLYTNGLRADIIYIDGSHLAKDVLADLVIAWKLLKTNGLLIADDYLWKDPQLANNLIGHPKIAIDSFCNCFFDEIQVIGLGHQAFLIKRASNLFSEVI